MITALDSPHLLAIHAGITGSSHLFRDVFAGVGAVASVNCLIQKQTDKAVRPFFPAWSFRSNNKRSPKFKGTRPMKKLLDRRGNLWVKSMDSGGVEETT